MAAAAVFLLVVFFLGIGLIVGAVIYTKVNESQDTGPEPGVGPGTTTTEPSGPRTYLFRQGGDVIDVADQIGIDRTLADNIDALKSACDAMEGCVAFTTTGRFKGGGQISPDRWTTDPSKGLYYIKDTLIPAPTSSGPRSYIFLQGRDVLDVADQIGMDRTLADDIDALKSACDAMEGCVAFTTTGRFKGGGQISPERWTTNPSKGLYFIEGSLAPPPPPPSGSTEPPGTIPISSTTSPTSTSTTSPTSTSTTSPTYMTLDGFTQVKGKYLYGWDSKKIENVASSGDCSNMCINEDGFPCRSFEYNPTTKQCVLSAGNTGTDTTEELPTTDIQYFTLDKLAASHPAVEFEDYTRSDEKKYPDNAISSSVQAYSVSDCKTKCDNEPGCYAFSWRSSDTLKQCNLVNTYNPLEKIEYIAQEGIVTPVYDKYGSAYNYNSTDMTGIINPTKTYKLTPATDTSLTVYARWDGQFYDKSLCKYYSVILGGVVPTNYANYRLSFIPANDPQQPNKYKIRLGTGKYLDAHDGTCNSRVVGRDAQTDTSQDWLLYKVKNSAGLPVVVMKQISSGKFMKHNLTYDNWRSCTIDTKDIKMALQNDREYHFLLHEL